MTVRRIRVATKTLAPVSIVMFCFVTVIAEETQTFVPTAIELKATRVKALAEAAKDSFFAGTG
jgi:hypothetical protein